MYLVQYDKCSSLNLSFGDCSFAGFLAVNEIIISQSPRRCSLGVADTCIYDASYRAVLGQVNLDHDGEISRLTKFYSKLSNSRNWQV